MTAHNIDERKKLGEDLVSGCVLLIVLLIFVALLFPVYNKVAPRPAQNPADDPGWVATARALGFDSKPVPLSRESRAGRRSRIGTRILRVEPGGPFDRAGVQPGDLIPMDFHLLKRLLLNRRGRKLYLPAERDGHRIDVTIDVPRFSVPPLADPD